MIRILTCIRTSSSFIFYVEDKTLVYVFERRVARPKCAVLSATALFATSTMRVSAHQLHLIYANNLWSLYFVKKKKHSIWQCFGVAQERSIVPSLIVYQYAHPFPPVSVAAGHMVHEEPEARSTRRLTNHLTQLHFSGSHTSWLPECAEASWRYFRQIYATRNLPLPFRQ